jgi:iron complex outermembrane receptor protein
MKRFLTKMVFSLFLVIGCSAYLSAQKVVSGTITDASSGEALIGASVVIKGTQTGTITDVDGAYSLKANAGDVLVISYTGYGDQEIVVGNANTISVSLEPGKLLDEVVVVGYGTQKEKEITSAVVSVGKESFNRGPITDPAQLLQGKVAGLQIYNRGGDPNKAATIRLRGLSTVGANTEPLVVIDGIIGASLSNVDPNDIEKIDVLKDGSASAIYGSRGSSGVIIVTTKKGSKSDRVKLSYNGQAGINSRFRTIEVMDAAGFVAAGGTDLRNSTDWLGEVTRTGLATVHGVSAEGGSGNTSYRISGNFRGTEGNLKGSGFDQFNTRVNFGTKALNDKLSIDFNTSFTNRNSDFGFLEAARYALLYNPTAPVFGDKSPYPFASAQFGGYFESLGLFDSFNPVSIIEQNSNEGKRREFNYGATFGYNLFKGFTMNLRVAQQNNTNNNREYYATTSHFRGNATSPLRKGLARRYNDESKFKLIETFGTWTSTLGSSTNLTLTAGHSFQQNNFNSLFVSAGDFPWTGNVNYGDILESSQDLLNAGFIQLSSDASPDEKIIAFFGRANLTFNDAIFLNASLRREGSTKLGEGNKWGLFPAISAGVDLNKYLGLGNLDLFKLRAGYGVTGSLPQQSGLSQEVRVPVNGAGGAVTTRLLRGANPDLKWEEKGEVNVGIDMASGRLSGSLDLYRRNIKDFILDVTVENTQGFDRQTRNAGSLTTQGLEVALNYDILKGSSNTYTTGVVFSTYKSILDEYILDQATRANLGAPGQNGTNMILVREGEEIGSIWGPVFDSKDDKGNPKFKDINGDGKVIAAQDKSLDPNADFQILGNGIPDFELGWNNNLNLGGWNINAFFRGAFGHSLVNTFRAFYEPRVSTQSSYNYVNTSKAVEGLTTAQFSSLYVEKADFFKLDNLTISRGINTGSNAAIKNLNVSLTGQNLFVLTGYTGADPEPSLVDFGASDNGGFQSFTADVLSPGIDRRNNYFSARTVTLGLNFNF